MSPGVRKLIDRLVIVAVAIVVFVVTVIVIGLLIDVASSLLR